MFTQNYINYKKLCFFAIGYSGSQNFTDYNGNSVYGYRGASYDGDIGGRLTDVKIAAPGSYGVYFGTGTTQPTLSDYTMESPITSGLSVLGASLVEDHEGSSHRLRCVYTIQNTSESDITISEIGIFSRVNAANLYNLSTGTNQWKYVLMYRDILETPITIQAGKTKLIEYVFTFNQSQ